MPSHYKHIDGYFDFSNIYNEVSDRFPTDASFIEIGVWLGKSACYMAELLKEKKSNNKFYCLDHFMGEINAADQQQVIKKNSGNVYDLFLANMKKAEVNDFFIPLKDFSQNAAYKFSDGTFDFIFLDAEHSYGCVKNDLSTWYPKLKEKGVFAGHDYRDGVKKAVDEFASNLKRKVSQRGSSWIIV